MVRAVDEVMSLMRPQKAFRDVALVLDVAEDVPLAGIDHGDLVQVLLNLMLNAADVVPDAHGKIAVYAARRDASVTIAVEDNGPGVAAEVLSRLFEPFVTTKGIGQGTGLGLAVCRGLVESAGGTISVEPGNMGGARLIINLPGVVGA